MPDNTHAKLVVRVGGLPPNAGTPLRLTSKFEREVALFKGFSDAPFRLEFLSQHSMAFADQGGRTWCQTLEDERVEWFPANSGRAHDAADSWGGIVVHADELDKLRLDDTWMRLEPVEQTRSLDGVSL